MKTRLQFGLAVTLVVCAVPAWPQSGGDTPLGDVARNIRKAKVTTKPAEVHIDNDNFSKVMENSEARRMMSLPPQLSLGFGPMSAGTPLNSPDVNCSLSFSAHGIHLADSLGPPPAKEPVKDVAKDSAKDPAKDKTKDKNAKDDGVDTSIPAAELAKLEGPATIVGDSLQLSVFNGTGWQIEEITVGLTVLRHPSKTTATVYDTGRIVPGQIILASSIQIVSKRSDTTIVYHFKGAAAPNSRVTFTQPLGITLGADQEWHWGILEAKGTLAKSN